MRFQDIPQFPRSHYRVSTDWVFLEETLKRYDCRQDGNGLILDPDFQRGHVWTIDQQSSYVEYMLKGGSTGKEIYFNCSSWQAAYNTPIYCVDGLQRLTAARKFIANEVPVFGGSLFKDFEGRCMLDFHFNMLVIKSKRELLKVYLDFNSGGTPHNPDELKRIEAMIQNTPASETL